MVQKKLEAQLMAELSRRNIDFVAQYILNNQSLLPLLVDMALSNGQQIAMRAAWVMEKLSESIDGVFDSFLPAIIYKLPDIKFSSCRRTLSKVIMLHNIPPETDGELFSFCVSMLESPKEPVAVKANCMSIIFKLLSKYPELKNEVFTIIESQIINNSKGFASRFEVLKRRLNLS